MVDCSYYNYYYYYRYRFVDVRSDDAELMKQFNVKKARAHPMHAHVSFCIFLPSYKSR